MSYNPDTLSFEEPETDMVYVSGFPAGVTEEDVAQHFGQIGILKQDKKKGKPKIWLYRDKATNQLKVPCARAPARPCVARVLLAACVDDRWGGCAAGGWHSFLRRPVLRCVGGPVVQRKGI